MVRLFALLLWALRGAPIVRVGARQLEQLLAAFTTTSVEHLGQAMTTV